MNQTTKIAWALRLTGLTLLLSSFVKTIPPEIIGVLAIALVLDSWTLLYRCLTR